MLAHALRCGYHQSVAWRSGYVILTDITPTAKSFYEKYGMKMIKEAEKGILMGFRTEATIWRLQK